MLCDYDGHYITEFVGRLNPCFNGICSAIGHHRVVSHLHVRLNPCFNGICSAMGSPRGHSAGKNAVLILVLMEYALRFSKTKR